MIFKKKYRNQFQRVVLVSLSFSFQCKPHFSSSCPDESGKVCLILEMRRLNKTLCLDSKRNPAARKIGESQFFFCATKISFSLKDADPKTRKYFVLIPREIQHTLGRVPFHFTDPGQNTDLRTNYLSCFKQKSSSLQRSKFFSLTLAGWSRYSQRKATENVYLTMYGNAIKDLRGLS